MECHFGRDVLLEVGRWGLDQSLSRLRDADGICRRDGEFVGLTRIWCEFGEGAKCSHIRDTVYQQSATSLQ